MSYDYQTERPHVFQEEYQELFLSIRDRTFLLLKEAGAARMNEIMKTHTGSSWIIMACVDRLVELGEIKELPSNGMAQHRVFISTSND